MKKLSPTTMNAVLERLDRLPNVLSMIRAFEEALRTPGKTYLVKGTYDKRIFATGPISRALEENNSIWDIGFWVINALENANNLINYSHRGPTSFGLFKSDLPIISEVISEYKVRKFKHMRAQAYSLQEKLSA